MGLESQRLFFKKKINENLEELLNLVPIFKVPECCWLNNTAVLWLCNCMRRRLMHFCTHIPCYVLKMWGKQEWSTWKPYAIPAAIVSTEDSAHFCIYNRDSLQMYVLCEAEKKSSEKCRHRHIIRKDWLCRNMQACTCKRKGTEFGKPSHFQVNRI